jgi:hypothetical protein
MTLPDEKVDISSKRRWSSPNIEAAAMPSS